MPKICNYQNCRKRASYGVKRNEPLRCKLHKENMKLSSLICQCGTTRPYFNEPGKTTPICCYSCKTDTMVNVVSKKCQCGKHPIFNEPSETKPICCYSCKTDTMINVANKRCHCGKSQPLFNEPGETKPTRCSSCKTDTMVNVVSKRCKCGKHPSFNEPGKTTPICCHSCKTDTMVSVLVSKKCQCGKAMPYFNEPGETTPICCSSCKTDTMIDVKNKRCQCRKSQPLFNEPGETKPICCVSCKTDTMINIVSKRCQCGKSQPTFNEPGETKPICCVSCKTDTMIDILNKKCQGIITDNGICPFDKRGNKKYKNYCIECFRRNFPLDPLTFQIRSKTKEIAVRDYINANFEGFQHDKIMTTSHCDCSIKRRIDHRYLINNTLLVIETDENQHKSYDKMDEETRYDDLYMAFSGKWIYIRFNPDKYINKKGTRKNPTIANRLYVLKDEIEKQMKRIENDENTELVERIYLYYDGYD